MLEDYLRRTLVSGVGLALLLDSSNAVRANEQKKEMILFVAHNGKDYECFTETREYASDHPCYKKVQHYLEEKKRKTAKFFPPPGSVPVISPSPREYRTPEIRERYIARDVSFRDFSGRDSSAKSGERSGGHKECHKK